MSGWFTRSRTVGKAKKKTARANKCRRKGRAGSGCSNHQGQTEEGRTLKRIKNKAVKNLRAGQMSVGE